MKNKLDVTIYRAEIAKELVLDEEIVFNVLASLQSKIEYDEVVRKELVTDDTTDPVTTTEIFVRLISNAFTETKENHLHKEQLESKIASLTAQQVDIASQISVETNHIKAIDGIIPVTKTIKADIPIKDVIQ